MYRVRQQQQQQSLRQAEPLRTGVGYATELAGRDRAKFFRCPVEPHDAALLLPQQPHQQQQQQQEQEQEGEVQQLQSGTHYTSDGEVRSTSSFVLHFASTCPTANASSSSHARTWRSRRARAHHLPTLSRVSAAQDGNSNSNDNNNSRHATCDVAQQTDYRESEAQTEPYTPDYYIPDGALAEPEILQLAGLRWRDGLPAGQEEVDLLARLRRRRAVEAALPPPPSQRGGDDKDAAAAAMTRRYAMLHALEEQEWREREEHVARVQQRRLDAMAASLEAREQAAGALMQQRLAHMQQQRTDALRDQLARLEARRLADARRGVDQHIRIAATAAASSAARPGVSGASMSAQMAKAMTMPHAAAAAAAMTTTTPPSKADLIASYVKYGSAAAPPVVHGSLPCRRTDTSRDDDDDNKSNDSTTMPRHTTTTTTTAAAVVTTPVMYTRRRDYDVRPMLLGSVAGAAEVGEARATHLDATAFAVPVDAAVRRLSTLHKRRDAERLLRALDYAQAAIDRRKRRGRGGAATARRRRRDGDDKATTSVAAAADDSDSARRRRHAARENKNDSDSDDDSVAEAVAAMQGRSDDKDDDNDDTNASRQRVRVLDLYRATPRIARPDTPVLELDGDADEDEDEACLLLQRLLRGRAVQNTYYEGKERCRGLIAELQAASNAQYAERSLVDAHERHEMAMRQDAMVQSVLDAAEGGLVADALASLFHERTRQAEARRLAAQRAAAERARGVREADEQARRARECVARARAEVQYAACVRATDATVMCFLQDTFLAAVDEAALRDATAHEHARRVARQQQQQEQQQPDSVHAREAVVCDMLDDFVVPTVVRTLEQAGQRQHAQAPACAVLALAARGFVADDVDNDDNNDGSGGDEQST